MRIDDRLETALRQRGEKGAGASAKWQQLIDLLSQNPRQFDPQSVAMGLLEARTLAPLVDVATREACVKGLRGRIRSAPLVQLLAGDAPQVASAAINGAELTDAEWADIVPHMNARTREILRTKQDIGPDTRHALSLYAAGDYVLPNDSAVRTAASPDDAEAGRHIREILDRIEQLQQARESGDAPMLPLEGGSFSEFPERIDEIRFETDENGTVTWVEGAPRGAIVGVDIAEPAFDTGPGPDAYGAAAFRQRMPLENARMRLCGSEMIAGDWRINAAPFFNAINGRFSGYRGIFRRPTLTESARIDTASSAIEGEQLQQLVHELRTPLGAIIGFAEIIEQQLFGPVTEDYRILARNILNDAQRLLAGFDDLAIAAKIETGQFTSTPGSTDCSWLAGRLAERLQGLSDHLGVSLHLTHAHPVRPLAIDSELAERIFSRLLSAVIIGCEPGEEMGGRFRTELGAQPVDRFILSLPKRLRSLEEAELFGTGPTLQDNAEEAPLLGLGFSLRLVRNLARNAGGDLRFYNEALILSLPAIQDGQAQLRDEERE